MVLSFCIQMIIKNSTCNRLHQVRSSLCIYFIIFLEYFQRLVYLFYPSCYQCCSCVCLLKTVLSRTQIHAFYVVSNSVSLYISIIRPCITIKQCVPLPSQCIWVIFMRARNGIEYLCSSVTVGWNILQCWMSSSTLKVKAR